MVRIDSVKPINLIRVCEVLSSERISDDKKADFIKNNKIAIENILKNEISKSEFNMIMSKRPLIKYRPLKNSFTKHGDDIILAKSLNIDKKDINKYINSAIETGFNIENDKTEKIKTYIYRHGTKRQLLAVLENELSNAKETLNVLYHVLDRNSGGITNYFFRPIHRLDNRTLSKLYCTIDKALRNSYNCGYIDEEKLNIASKWALVRIYQIQNDQKILNAYKLYNELENSGQI